MGPLPSLNDLQTKTRQHACVRIQAQPSKGRGTLLLQAPLSPGGDSRAAVLGSAHGTSRLAPEGEAERAPSTDRL